MGVAVLVRQLLFVKLSLHIDFVRLPHSNRHLTGLARLWPNGERRFAAGRLAIG
jgi:hypothetical protein